MLFASSLVACSGQSSLPNSPNSGAAQNSSAAKGSLAPDLTCSGDCGLGGGGGSGSGGSGSGGTGNGNCRLIAKRDAATGCGTGSGSGGGSTVAVHPGPTDGQTCNGSLLSIGDNVGAVSGHPETVTDINVIATASGLPFSTGDGQLGVDTYTAGWMYKDANGNYWVQSNPAANWSVSVSVSAWFASLGITTPSVTTPEYAGTTPPTMPSGTTTQRCFTGGSNFG